MLLPNRDPRIGELSDRIDNPRLREGVLLYLASVGLVAAAIIVLFSIASFSLLGTTKETLTGSRIDNNPIEDVSIDTAVFYGGNITPVPVPTKLPSSSEATNLPSSTLVPPPSGMSGERTTVEPALKPLPHGETSAMAVETAHGSTKGPLTDEASPPEPIGSQQVIAQPLSIAAETDTAAADAPLGSTVGPSIDEAPPPEPIGSQQVIAQPLSIAAETGTAAVDAPLGSTVGPSTDEAPPPEPIGSQQVIAQPLSIAAETGTAAVELPLGSTVGPSIDEAPPAEPIGSQQVIVQPLSIADEASASQHASGATMPWVTTSDGEPYQKSQNFRKIQRNHHANLEESSAAFTLENRFPENQVKESMRFHGYAASAGSDPPLLHAASRGRRAIKANRDEIADRLNHAELSRLLAGGRAAHRALGR
jgi:hypothetical protein